MVRFEFELYLSAEQFRRYYQGRVNSVQVKTKCGRNVRFNAEILRKYVSQDGVQGNFVLTLDENHKFISLVKMAG